MRIIYIPDELIAALQEWKKDCPIGPLDLVFPTGAGEVEGYRNLRTRCWDNLMAMAKLVDEANKPLFGFHQLRHYRVSMLISRGMGLKDIMDQIGHADSRMTMELYGHLFVDEMAIDERRKQAQAIAYDMAGTQLVHE